MSRSYNNITKYLTDINYTIVETIEEYISSRVDRNSKFTIRCPLNHDTNMSLPVFNNNKISINNGKRKQMCSICNSNNHIENNLEIYRDQIMKNTGHELLTLDKDRKITYRCGTCSNINSSFLQSLNKTTTTKYCSKCFNEYNNKYSFEEVQKIINENNMTLVSTEYKSNNQKLDLICKCGEPYQSTLKEIRRKKNCQNCKKEKYKLTCQEKYGVDNTFQSSEIKEKILQSNIQNNGVQYPQQNPTIRKKTEETCIQKYGVKHAFAQLYVYEKIRQTHYDKYGVNYPFQSKEIQEKIERTFMKKYNVRRPFLCQEFSENIKKIMQEKYGSEYYVTSQHCKDQMQEKYGSEYYVTSQHCKDQMQEKYGSEYYVTSQHCKDQMQEKYGSEYYLTSQHYKDQMQEKYGSEYYLTSQHCKDQMQEKYGSEYYVTSQHCKDQMQEKYGSEYYLTSQHYKDFMLRTYGEISPMHVPEIFHKAVRSLYSRKEFRFPSGIIKLVMGYEHLTLRDIMTNNFRHLKRPLREEEIKVGEEVETFKYIDRNEKRRRYYPDISVHISEENPIYIEVKSVYVFNRDPESNYDKWKAVSENGFDIYIYLYSAKKLIDIWYFSKFMKKSPRSKNKNIDSFEKCITITKNNLYQIEFEEYCMENFVEEFE